MKKLLSILVIVLIMTLFMVSLSSAQWSNYASPQLDYISNTFPLLWNKPKTEVQRLMSIFPDYVGTDYGDQLVYVSKYNTDRHNNIYINFFMDDYEEHHDNLWKVTVTADVQSAGEMQDFFRILYIEGMKPFHTAEDQEFTYKGVVPLRFDNENTIMMVYFQHFDINNDPFFLAEYYNGYRGKGN